ncbi:MAG: metalloregulator ArsR/SmtB family transcription factor [bacterium]
MLNQGTALNRLFHALADPTRRAMISRLARGPASVGELAEPLSMSLPSVMQHIRVLEDSGLVHTQKSGRVRTCRIDPDRLREAERWLSEQRTLWEGRLDRLDAFLRDTQHGEDK